MKTKFLSSSDIETIIIKVGIDSLLDQLIHKLREAFSDRELQNAQIPARSGLYYTKPDLGLLEWMPAALGNRASLKIVGYHPTNPDKRQLPTILSTLCAFDTDSGHMRGILDGTFPTALRTGAMSAIASSILAPKDSSITLAFLGGGAQAVTQAHALSRIRTIKKIVVYDKNYDAAKSLESRIAFLGLPVQPVDKESFNQRLSTFDVLCTCTSEIPGSGALFKDFKNKEGLHINAVGSDFPGKFEIPIELLQRSFVCPDFLEQAFVEGECQQLRRDQVDTDLAALLKSSESFQRKKRDRLSVFDSTGHGYADFVTVSFFLDYASKLGLGNEIELESIPVDPLDPYSFFNKSNLNECFSPVELMACK